MDIVDVEDVIKYLKFKPTVADRLRRLNPHPLYVGYKETSKLRGYHPKLNKWVIQQRYYLIPMGEVVRKHGRDVVAKFDSWHVRKWGRRVYVTYAALQELGIRP